MSRARSLQGNRKRDLRHCQPPTAVAVRYADGQSKSETNRETETDPAGQATRKATPEVPLLRLQMHRKETGTKKSTSQHTSKPNAFEATIVTI